MAWFASRAARGDTMVLGAFFGLNAARRAAIRSAILGMASAQTAEPPRQGRSVVGWLACLIRRPSLVVTEGGGLVTLLSCAYRLVSRDATLLVFLAESPRPMRLFEHVVLKVADGVLVDGDAVAQALADPALPARAIARIASGRPLDRFLQVAPARAPQFARRMVVVGELTPESGAADLLVTVSAWSEAHPDQRVELTWVGRGDLVGLLAAQPLPRNLVQMFLGPQDTDQLAATFEASGLLVVPSLARSTPAPVAEALAAGLPVLGSSRSRDVRQLVTDQVNGWLFDPLAPGAMFDALSRALGTDDLRLDEMRSRARAAMSAQPSSTLPLRTRQRVPGAGLGPEYQRAP